MLESMARLLGPLHPPLTHFPIVCSILAVLSLGVFLWTKKDWLQEAAAWLWVLTFLSALAGGLSGHLFALHLGLEDHLAMVPSGNILGGLLRDHVLWATAATVLSLFTLGAAIKILKGSPWPAGIQLALGLSCAICFGLTGQHGGEMVYGEAKSSEDPSTPTADLLGSAAGYQKNLVKMNAKTWNSRTHGHRFVNTYVSKEAVEAYKISDPLPEGTLVVKDSVESRGGKPSGVPGPLYVMKKGKVSDSPATGGWRYALVWERPVAGNPEGIEGPVKWLPGDPHLSSCVKCHNRFKSSDYMGGIPEGAEAP